MPPQLLALLRNASRTYDRPIQRGILLLYSKQDTTLDVAVISTRLFLKSEACQQPAPKPIITAFSVSGGQHPGDVHWDEGVGEGVWERVALTHRGENAKVLEPKWLR